MGSEANSADIEIRSMWRERKNEGEGNESELSACSDNEISDEDCVFEDEEAATSSEESADEIEDVTTAGTQSGRQRARGKDGHIWSLVCPERRGRPSGSNLIRKLPGVIGAAKNIKFSSEAWNLLINDEIFEIIEKYTNEEINRKAPNYSQHNIWNIRSTDKTELRALFGLYYIAGVLKNSKLSVDELWSPDFGNSIFRATMSQRRFIFLSSCLRFDDKNTRDQRKEFDKFAAFREVWEIFIGNCKMYYYPGMSCTIDEQLVGTRCRCPFRIYLPNKPDKYGIKIVMLNDARTFYMYNAMPYTGTVSKPSYQSVPEYYVEKLSEDLWGTHRNITTDNWFTSVPLVDRMLDQHNLTMVGTIRKNKRQIPLQFLKKKNENSSIFGFDGRKTLVSYSPKKNKNVLVISTLHHDNSIDRTTGKPNIILTYNETKGGTDSFDQLCHTYTTARKTPRWTHRMLFAVLDQSAINAYILLYLANPTWKDNTKHNRRFFLKELGLYLIKDQMEKRYSNPKIQRNIKVLISEILNKSDPNLSADPLPSTSRTVAKRQRCYLCDRVKDRKTTMTCSKCQNPICVDHVKKICPPCYDGIENMRLD